MKERKEKNRRNEERKGRKKMEGNKGRTIKGEKT